MSTHPRLWLNVGVFLTNSFKSAYNLYLHSHVYTSHMYLHFAHVCIHAFAYREYILQCHFESVFIICFKISNAVHLSRTRTFLIENLTRLKISCNLVLRSTESYNKVNNWNFKQHHQHNYLATHPRLWLNRGQTGLNLFTIFIYTSHMYLHFPHVLIH